MKKVLSFMLVGIMLLTVLSACQDPATNTGSTAPTAGATAAATPANSGGNTGGEKARIEIFINPWVGSPIEGEDPYKAWVDQLTGADWVLTAASDFKSELMTRAAANSMPDLIAFDTYVELNDMYNQDVLISDWNIYADRMPNTMGNISETAMLFFTQEGKLTCVPTKSGAQLYAFNIRTDWLNTLGLSMPTTPDELLDVARAFTFNDPDGNGQDDTYAFTSAGAGKNVGEIIQLAGMFGPTNYYITEDGNVSIYLVDGRLKEYLDFMRVIVNENLIDPDWYTIGWDERKPNLFNGNYGICYYPPEALFSETETARDGDGIVLDWWEYMPMIDANGNGSGGKLPALSPLGQIRTVSASAAASEAKMDAIITFLEETAIPNWAYYMFRAGADIDKIQLKELDNGRIYGDSEASKSAGARKGDGEGQCLALANYGLIINSYAPEANVVWGSAPDPDAAVLKSLDMSDMIAKAPRYSDDHYLLNLSTDNTTQADAIRDEFMINYILGETDDYEGFVAQWLNGGGQALLDEAKEQFISYGIIK